MPKRNCKYNKIIKLYVKYIYNFFPYDPLLQSIIMVEPYDEAVVNLLIKKNLFTVGRTFDYSDGKIGRQLVLTDYARELWEYELLDEIFPDRI